MSEQDWDGPSPTQIAKAELAYRKGLEGDQEMLSLAIQLFLERLNGQGVRARYGLRRVERSFLTLLLSRIAASPQGLNIASGMSARPGAGKRGKKGLAVAFAVRALNVEGHSIESAWAQVAEQFNLSEGMVKKHWKKWKLPVASVFERTSEIEEAHRKMGEFFFFERPGN